ncbi:hypothetical protein [Candidatus Agathobaculum pullicola]|uniref:hypothetical protein n=1 Tax=Candidatus Agathobaculum pullicola TaxID=2838426 RepID=UPI003F92F814
MQTSHNAFFKEGPFSEEEEAVLQYLDGLIDTAKQTIFISRVATRLNYDYWESAAILSSLADAWILMQHDVLCCPECGCIIKSVDGAEGTGTEHCVHCDAQVDMSGEGYLDCIEVRYALVKTEASRFA